LTGWSETDFACTKTGELSDQQTNQLQFINSPDDDADIQHNKARRYRNKQVEATLSPKKGKHKENDEKNKTRNECNPTKNK